ncbi:MAG: ion transporter [Myxococcales bacterium]|nr:ion transporter [Myxococcales bacterium]
MSENETVEPRAASTPKPFGLADLFTADKPVLIAIALNAVVLFLLAFDELAFDPILEVLDYAFTTYFVIEAALKLHTAGVSGYFRERWNRFDFVVVLLSLPSYVVLFVELPDLSFLLLLRLARVMKFFRFIRFVPNMPELVAGARRAIQASAFVVLAFFIFNFVVALVSCHLFHTDAPEHFGNPVVSFYSIFKVFTVEGWYEIPDAITENASSGFAFFTRAYFMVIVVSGGIFGLSLVNAIFVDEMLRNENDLIEKRIDELHAKLDALLAATSARGALVVGDAVEPAREGRSSRPSDAPPPGDE